MMDLDNATLFGEEDTFDSLLNMEGNYFIMDSEQLVANPFQEMQQDVVNEAQKKNTMTERLTSVKNNVCENHFQMAQRRLERQKTQRMKQLHDHSNKLRHEVKLLDLDRQRHTVEIKKRLMPDRDFSYDDLQIVNTEKRLGANIASFYLDKKMKYPTRLRSVSDLSVTPTIRKARASIREQQTQKSLEEYLPESRQERANTAKTNSSIHKGSVRLARRRDSRSAPAYTRLGRHGNGEAKPDSSSTTLPAIDQEAGRRDAWGSKTGNSHHPSPQQVRFAFENPLKILASSEESANLFAKAHPYYPGMVRAVNFGSDTSDDDDDDDLYATEIIDLRSILFGGGDARAASAHSSPNCLSQQQLAAIRKAQGPAPKLTTDMKQEESNYINSKINAFLENLAMSRMRTRRDSDDIFDDLDSVAVNQEVPSENAKVQSKSTSTGMMTDKDGGGDDTGNTKSTSTFDLQGETRTFLHSASHAYPQPSQDSTKINDGHATATQNVSKGTTTAQTTTTTDKNNNNNNKDTDKTNKEDDLAGDIPHRTRYSWRCIKGRPANGELRGSYSAEDMVLQALTGVPLSNMLSGHVPLHSASRAMRHTATFKMHKIVEKLVNERTKYERHQVEELKRQMETEDQQADKQSSTRRTSNSSIGSRTSQVAAK